LKPEYEVPYIPTFPFDHGCLEMVMPLSRGVLVFGDALRRAGATDVDAAHREPAFVGESPVDRNRPADVVLPVGARLEHDWPRAFALGQVQGGRDADSVRHPQEDAVLGHDSSVRARTW
jgi:hypothetical protein